MTNLPTRQASPNRKVIAQHEVEGQYAVTWWRTGKKHHIVYGFDVSETHDLKRAAELFGYAVLHQITCDGRMDE